MSKEDDVTIEAFQARVLQEIRILQTMVEINAGFRHSSFKSDATKKQGQKKARGFFGFNLFMRLEQYMLKTLGKQKRINERTAQVRSFLKEPETKQRLCAGLRVIEDNLSRLEMRSVEHDATEIAHAVTPLLLPLARAKSISLEDDPVAFALSAWMIARTGIALYCQGYAGTDPLSL